MTLLNNNIKVNSNIDNNIDNKYDNIFDKIDSNEKAYLLGWIALNGRIYKSKVIISVKYYDKDILEKINKYIELPLRSEKGKMVNLTIKSESIVKKLIEIFKITDLSKKSYTIKFPDIDDKYLYYFIRGIFEGNGHFRYTKNNPICIINSNSNDFLQEIINKCELKCKINKNNYNYLIQLYGNSALDFLNKIYKNVLINKELLYMNRKYNFYKRLCGWVPNVYKNPLYFNYIRTVPEAKSPQKQRSSDSGYDLTLIKKIKTFGNVEFYDTCIKLEPAFGYYFDLVGRSSITKSGYMLANNIGIIDRTYQGTIIVPLIKIDNNQPDLELPSRLVQIIPRQIQHLEPIEITEDKLLLSDRNIGGFGSTNN